MTDDAHAARRKHLNRTRRIEVELARLEVEDRIYVLATGRRLHRARHPGRLGRAHRAPGQRWR